MDCSSDSDHNRSVIPFIAPASVATQAALSAARAAIQLIDLTSHKGVHPCFGAADVIPFVPIDSSDMPAAVLASQEAARSIAGSLDIPVYLYEQSATRPELQNLAEVRKIRSADPGLSGVAPDFGPPWFHPTAGAVAIGARGPLVAYNVDLATPDVHIARVIANRIRSQRGTRQELRGVKALGLYLESRGIAQVSTNVTLPEQCSPRAVWDFIVSQAAEIGVQVLGSELIGIVSNRHLPPEDIKAMHFYKPIRPGQIIEAWLSFD